MGKKTSLKPAKHINEKEKELIIIEDSGDKGGNTRVVKYPTTVVDTPNSFKPPGNKGIAEDDTRGDIEVPDILEKEHYDEEVQQRANYWHEFNQDHKHWELVPKDIRAVISSIRNVNGDGHCGFRAAAVSMGQGEDSWPQIRKAMLQEMKDQPIYRNQSYLEAVADSAPYSRLEATLNYFRSPAKFNNWIKFPLHGDLLADTFQRPVIYITESMKITFLPLSHGAGPSTNPPILLLYLEGHYHYNAFKFDGEIYPAPSVSSHWFKWRQNVAKDWEKSIQLNRDEWKRRIPQQPSELPVVVDVEYL
ncbi:uncharacterized protein PGTG_12818 [Puccinia graminis f. sp. tritici CRL 75-36-700-3]|uniref:OTU domain-containing protein n=1 Tax=Puccinia graminis f. sp. tritici (strain CRL 75-36-700-3 / race SCCL) TaxID=418459 RepID=E3KSE8_PUCGT|nr:uncharacterized protein PGTG_12818 [Puccinia graminis f. sp. tritici CRL 75-36-700-3]EFP87234.1 hypothetical protein PGTG_12818 [Puccinia graminis f. sp. tritici CRL 75-36-700-3]